MLAEGLNLISLVLDVGEELGVHKGVLMLVSVHTHHEAHSAPSHNNQHHGDPKEGLHRNQISHLVVHGDIARDFHCYVCAHSLSLNYNF